MLIGTTQIAKLLGVHYKTLMRDLDSLRGFPDPVLDDGPYRRKWRRAEVEAWINPTGPQPLPSEARSTPESADSHPDAR